MTTEAHARVGYVGLVTRAVALAIDAVIINVIAVLTGGALNLIASAFGGDGNLNAAEAVVGGFAWFLWSAAYFVTFWSLTGQTPGDRILGIRVVAEKAESIGLIRGLRRFAGLVIAMIPLGAGFLPILVDDRRRGLQDFLAGTVVLWDEAKPGEVRAAVPLSHTAAVVLTPSPGSPAPEPLTPAAAPVKPGPVLPAQVLPAAQPNPLGPRVPAEPRPQEPLAPHPTRVTGGNS